MANKKSAEKHARQSLKLNAHNNSVLSALKTEQKKFRSTLAENGPEAARAVLQSVSSKLDKAAKRGIIHQNAADRRKGTFARALKATAAAE